MVRSYIKVVMVDLKRKTRATNREREREREQRLSGGG